MLQTTSKYTLTKAFIVGAFCIGGLAACNSDDYRETDRSGDSSSVSGTKENNSSNRDNSPTVSSADKPGSMDSASATTGATAGSSDKATGAAASKGSDMAKSSKRKGHATVIMPTGTDMSGAGAGGSKAAMVKDKDGVYSSVQVMPEFPGGQAGLSNYVNNHVEYQQQAIDDNTTGTVKVSFVVDENGKVTNAHIVNGNKTGNGLEQEALRVLNTMPAWKPGKVNGKNVKTRLELPINFQFEA